MREPNRPLRRALWMLPALLLFAAGGPADAGGGAALDRAGPYAGVFVGAGRADSRIVDTDGFSNEGNPGAVTDYGDDGPVGGALIGQRFGIGGAPFRVELDGMFGRLSAKTNKIDPNPTNPPRPPGGHDETVESKFRWVATARGGIEHAVGPATVFAAAGLAVARIDNSLTDLDRKCVDCSVQPPLVTPWRLDPDDSFRDGSTEIGWVVGVGVEASVADRWTLRLEASYMDFGRTTHTANRSGNDDCCGSGTPERPVSYDVEHKLGILRLAVVRRFDW